MTNYISQDRGRPLHVYDAAKLKGAITARMGKAGEKFMALDGREYAVDETMCVIADDTGPLGLGGIIGGEASGSTDDTVDVLIECAYFDPLRTAATGRKAGLVTDARYRFERGVDPQWVLPGLDLATQMIMKVAGGKPSKAAVAGKVPDTRKAIVFDLGRVEKLGGIKVPADEIKTILETLGCVLVGDGDTLEVTPPSWRPDIHGSADLVEEVVRIAGIDNIPSTPLPRVSGVARPVLTERQKRSRRVAPPACGAWPRRSRDLVVHSARPGRAVRRRTRGHRARKSDFDRSRGHAPEPHSGAAHRGRAQSQSRLR